MIVSVKDPVLKCRHCNAYFLSDTILSQHKESQHGIRKKANNQKKLNTGTQYHNRKNLYSRKPIQNANKPNEIPDHQNNKNVTQNLNIINMNNEVIQISETSNDSEPIPSSANTNLLNTMVTHIAEVKCDSVVKELIKKADVTKLMKQPVVLVERMSELLLNGQNTNTMVVHHVNQEHNSLNEPTSSKITEVPGNNVAIVRPLDMADSAVRSENIRNRIVFEADDDDDLMTNAFDGNTNVLGSHRHTEVNVPDGMDKANTPSVGEQCRALLEGYFCRFCGLEAENL